MEREEIFKKLREKERSTLLARYKMVCDHSYRVLESDRLVSYLNEFVEMMSAWYDYWMAVYDPEYKDVDASPLKVYHDCAHFADLVKDNSGERKRKSEAVIIIERYLAQVHRFLDAGTCLHITHYTAIAGQDMRWWEFRFFPEDECWSIDDCELDDYAHRRHLVTRKDFLAWCDEIDNLPGRDRINRFWTSIARRFRARMGRE